MSVELNNELFVENEKVFIKKTKEPFSGYLELEGAKGEVLNGLFSGKWVCSLNAALEVSDILFELFSFSSNIFDTYYDPLNELWDSKKTIVELDFIDGKLTGLKNVFSLPDKRLVSSEEFKNSRRNGKCVTYNAHGDIVISKCYENGYLSGPFQYFDTNNQSCIMEGSFHNGKKTGLWKMNFKHLKKYGYKFFNASSGLLQNSQSVYHEKFIDKSETGTSDVKELESYFLYKQVKTLLGDDLHQDWDEITYKDDKFNGVLKKYHPNGKAEVISNYCEGHQEGLHIRYNENGLPKLETNYKIFDKGAPYQKSWEHGNCKWFHQNGQLKTEGRMVKGNPDGVWKDFDENGIQVSEKSYDAAESERKITQMLNRSSDMSNDISDAIGGSEFMTDSEKDVFGV